jgi:hypothetical protein
MKFRYILSRPVLVLSIFQFDLDEVVGQTGNNLTNLMQDDVFDPNVASAFERFAQAFEFFVPHGRAPFFGAAVSNVHFSPQVINIPYHDWPWYAGPALFEGSGERG